MKLRDERAVGVQQRRSADSEMHACSPFRAPGLGRTTRFRGPVLGPSPMALGSG